MYKTPIAQTHRAGRQLDCGASANPCRRQRDKMNFREKASDATPLFTTQRLRNGKGFQVGAAAISADAHASVGGENEQAI